MIIKQVENGLIVKNEGITMVFEDTHQIASFIDFLYYINEVFGPSTSRHSPERIQISTVPGEKYE